MTRSDDTVARSPLKGFALHTKSGDGWDESDGGAADRATIIAALASLSLESRTRADGVNWLNGPTGNAIAVPAGAKTMIIRPIASNAYFRFGNSTVTAAAPTGAVSDGSGSRFLFEGEAIQVAVGTATHYAVVATGLVEVDWWLS
ncbi:hypothetical protein [Deinococcus misasensis]|uniref:hypothetical protein n=1 Tax=Deinococcus misasensis TaxID=392413 RepID=UPI000550DC79|nr:hypothetical protein [Deinococcus misasensis]